MGNNSGEQGKKFGAARTKRGRFNANPVACGHPSCFISLRSKLDKKAAEKASRIVKRYISKATGIFHV